MPRLTTDNFTTELPSAIAAAQTLARLTSVEDAPHVHIIAHLQERVEALQAALKEKV